MPASLAKSLSTPVGSVASFDMAVRGVFILRHRRGRAHERGVVEAVFLFDGAVEERAESVKVRDRGGRGWN